MGLYPLHFPDVSLYNNFMEKTLQLIETAYENPQAPITEELRNAIEKHSQTDRRRNPKSGTKRCRQLAS